MGREENVERSEFRMGWWEGSSQQRILELRRNQPTTYRVTLYGLQQPSEEEIKEALDKVDPAVRAVIEFPPEREAFRDHEAHQVEVSDGTLVIKKVIGVGNTSAGWETLAIYPPGEWKRCEAIKFREAEKDTV
jgi:hypothetical protein